jgi:predicted PurR-regulated permease PerM
MWTRQSVGPERHAHGGNAGRVSGSRAAIPSTTAAIWIVAIVATVWFLREARGLLIPVALAVLISYALEPVVGWLERRRVSRLLGAGLVMLSILAAIAAGAYVFRDDALDVIRTLPRAMERAREGVASKLGLSADALPGSNGARQSGGEQAAGAEGRAQDGPGEDSVGIGSLFSFGGHLVVVFFLTFFLLISTPRLHERLLEVASPNAEDRRTTAVIFDDINRQIQRYLLVLLVTALMVAAATWIVLAWQKVPHAAMWGILAGLFNSIPYFGPVIVCGGLFVVGLAQGGMSQALLIAGVALLITSLEGWLVTPALMGKAERMNALAIFVGLIVWIWLWGEWGTILAVPMLAVIKSVADRVDGLKRVGRLMAP